MGTKVRHYISGEQVRKPVLFGVQMHDTEWRREVALVVAVPSPAGVYYLCPVFDILPEGFGPEDLEQFRKSFALKKHAQELMEWLQSAVLDSRWANSMNAAFLFEEGCEMPDFLREMVEKLMASDVLRSWLEEVARKRGLQVETVVLAE